MGIKWERLTCLFVKQYFIYVERLKQFLHLSPYLYMSCLQCQGHRLKYNLVDTHYRCRGPRYTIRNRLLHILQKYAVGYHPGFHYFSPFKS